MESGLRKVVHLEVFDFDSDPYAYAKLSHKNQFGYKIRTDLVRGDTVVETGKEINSVEQASYYYNKYGINLPQLGKLRRKVRSLTRDGMYPFIDDDKIVVVVRGGTEITYAGKHQEEFQQKVLRIK